MQLNKFLYIIFSLEMQYLTLDFIIELFFFFVFKLQRFHLFIYLFKMNI